MCTKVFLSERSRHVCHIKSNPLKALKAMGFISITLTFVLTSIDHYWILKLVISMLFSLKQLFVNIILTTLKDYVYSEPDFN